MNTVNARRLSGAAVSRKEAKQFSNKSNSQAMEASARRKSGAAVTETEWDALERQIKNRK